MHNNSIQLVRITSEDITLLHALSRQTFSETFSPVNTPENMQYYLDTSLTVERLQDEINNPDSIFYFSMRGDKAVGYVKVNFGQAQTELQDHKGMEIERIYVLKEFHGEKIGQLLFNKALEVARDKKVEYVWLGVWEKNHKAIGFYEKNGFVQFGAHAFRLGTDEQIDLMMKLIIKEDV